MHRTLYWKVSENTLVDMVPSLKDDKGNPGKVRERIQRRGTGKLNASVRQEIHIAFQSMGETE